jgi:F-type H+-transporting ATPase subunit alpha
VAGTLRLDLAQFREMAAFAQFASDLDKATQQQLARGERLVEVLKQGQYVPMSVEEQIVSIYAAINGHLDAYGTEVVGRYEQEMHVYIRSTHKDLLEAIRTKKQLNDEIKGKLNAALSEFGKGFDPKKKQG